MFVRCKRRFKDGKEHRYWSVVENVRVCGGRVVQRHVLYLGEINDSQRAAWCRSIEVVEGKSRSRQMALFPEDREAPALRCEVASPLRDTRPIRETSPDWNIRGVRPIWAPTLLDLANRAGLSMTVR